jgi:hypothetical protein
MVNKDIGLEIEPRNLLGRYTPATAVDSIAKVVPETLMTRQGHIAALAVDAGLDPRILTHLL